MANENTVHLEQITRRLNAQQHTLSGDLRDAVLRLIKELPKPWQKMTGDEQQATIDVVVDFADLWTRDAYDVMAAAGADRTVVKLSTNFSVDEDSIICRITAPKSPELVSVLMARGGRDVILVARDADAFLGERRPAATDNIGDLAMPARPAPTPDAMTAAEVAANAASQPETPPAAPPPTHEPHVTPQG